MQPNTIRSAILLAACAMTLVAAPMGATPQGLQREIELQEANLRLARSDRVPNITVSAGVQGFRVEDGENDHAFVLGVGLPLQIFDRGRRGAEEARHNLAKALEERRAAKVEVRNGLAITYEALAAAHARVVALRDDVLPSAERSPSERRSSSASHARRSTSVSRNGVT